MKKNYKKGQIAGQIFIYMTAVIVIGGIALIGYSAIKNITTKACNAGEITFKTDIEWLIEKHTSHGSSEKETLRAPCGYDEICFVDASKIGVALSDGGISDCENNIIKDSVVEGVEQNIFVISNGKTHSIGYSQLISLSATDNTGCLCIQKRNNNFYILFNGQGSSSEIHAG
jgi:hypothetical protein